MRSCLCVLEGGLLSSACGFPYLFLLAFDAGSIIRAFLLLLVYPIALACEFFFSGSLLGSRILLFTAFCGLRSSAVESAARAVLPKFYLEDLRWEGYKEFIRCEKRSVISFTTPAIMIEAFLREFLETEQVFGLEMQRTSGGYFTGLVASMPDSSLLPVQVDVGISTRSTQTIVHSISKESLVLESSGPAAKRVPRSELPKPLIFHDGRLAVRPTPVMALTIFLWLPIGLMLAIPRSLILVLSPNISFIIFCEAALGIVMRYKGNPFQRIPSSRNIPGPVERDGTECTSRRGNLYVCSHRTLMDPVFLSGMVFRRVTAVTYSISRLTELLAPIRTVRLTRCRWQDSATITGHLTKGDLIMCPEGTTCREPYLLRFSKLFVEIADAIIPVAIDSQVQFFHGTSVRGWKAMDPFFFALNPRPVYWVEFLEGLSLTDLAEREGVGSLEIANMIQKRIADALGFECTDHTRKDKYRILAGHEGSVVKQRIRNILHNKNNNNTHT